MNEAAIELQIVAFLNIHRKSSMNIKKSSAMRTRCRGIGDFNEAF